MKLLCKVRLAVISLRIAALVFLLGLTGCGQKLHPVKGQVVFKDGKPLQHGMVIFEPVDSKGQNASPRGEISKEGTFQMSSHAPGDGVLPGKYRVYLADQLPATPRRARSFPSQYESPETSGLTYEVPGEGKPLTIHLERP